MTSYRPPPTDRPRERLFAGGAAALSDSELLAVMLGSGTEKTPVRKLAAQALAVIDRRNGALTAADLCRIDGFGPAKAALVSAALEFARRRIKPEGHKISAPEDVPPLVRHLLDRKQECFVVISLNGAHEVIALRIITIGTVNSCQVHPREVFADAITDRAAAIVAVHNHPSGQLKPSEHDRRLTAQLTEAGKILGIPLLDHIIVGRGGFYSFTDSLPVVL